MLRLYSKTVFHYPTHFYFEVIKNNPAENIGEGQTAQLLVYSSLSYKKLYHHLMMSLKIHCHHSNRNTIDTKISPYKVHAVRLTLSTCVACYMFVFFSSTHITSPQPPDFL